MVRACKVTKRAALFMVIFIYRKCGFTPVAALTRWLRTGVLPDALAAVAPCLMCVHCAAALDGATCLLKKRPACNLAG